MSLSMSFNTFYQDNVMHNTFFDYIPRYIMFTYFKFKKIKLSKKKIQICFFD